MGGPGRGLIPNLRHPLNTLNLNILTSGLTCLSSSYLLSGRSRPLPNTCVGCNLNTHQLVRRESFQEVLICVGVCDPDIFCSIVVIEIYCVIYNDAIGSVRRFPFNEQRICTGACHYNIDGGVCRYCKDKELLCSTFKPENQLQAVDLLSDPRPVESKL